MYRPQNMPEICRSCRNEVPPGAEQCEHCGRIFNRSAQQLQPRIPQHRMPMQMPPRAGNGPYMPSPYPGQMYQRGTRGPPGYPMPVPHQPHGMYQNPVPVEKKKKKSKKTEKKADKVVESSSDEEEEMITIRTKVKKEKKTTPQEPVPVPPTPPPAPAPVPEPVAPSAPTEHRESLRRGDDHRESRRRDDDHRGSDRDRNRDNRSHRHEKDRKRSSRSRVEMTNRRHYSDDEEYAPMDDKTAVYQLVRRN